MPPDPIDNAMIELRVKPFTSAQEVWFWYCELTRVRQENGGTMPRNIGGPGQRPGELSDALLPVIRLARLGSLSRTHIGVMRRYGDLQYPPDPGRADEEGDAALWSEAMALLAPYYRMKGMLMD